GGIQNLHPPPVTGHPEPSSPTCDGWHPEPSSPTCDGWHPEPSSPTCDGWHPEPSSPTCDGWHPEPSSPTCDGGHPEPSSPTCDGGQPEPSSPTYDGGHPEPSSPTCNGVHAEPSVPTCGVSQGTNLYPILTDEVWGLDCAALVNEGDQVTSPCDPQRSREAEQAECLPDNDINNKLLVAAAEGKTREVKALVKQGANLEARSTNPGEEGLTPLHLACWGGHKDAAVKLINLGANPQALAGGRLAVHWAAYGGHVDVLKALSDLGCDLDVISADKSTALHLAADNGNFEAVQWLVEHGVSVHTLNGDTRTALDLAKASRFKAVSLYLKRKGKEELLVRSVSLRMIISVKKLLEEGINVNASSYKKGQEGMYPTRERERERLLWL
ncbi:poly [ADP-ribose] polymerase tankyrase-1-like, partial [Homarus americanus]|uniref:poly [ADP-ribose] polymerase tankyrase-1-like n=1 Tax=Homarus americanus TaxID=6706 RepID=UPI001C4952E4